ncbi:protein NETWORKED 4B isoform X2 [Morus notabilis]|uniref:protein NETWORKED 4B isoform X2 n=1 Tax=Morus notabilis TaxID=981085 RepID=UPI000CED4EBA|nr:protein NETWORKED 4B isoform X2 [Morus notabilis]
MENNESNTPNSCCEINANSSKWLAENLKEMDHSVKRMLKLIEEDDSLSMSGEITSQRKSELVANVEEFNQLYRSLAERYDHVTKELCKSVSQGSGNTESGYDQDAALLTPDVKDGSESSSSSTSDSESESFVNNYLRSPPNINSQSLQKKITEMETELSTVKDKLQTREADLELEKERALELENQIVELETRVSDSDLKSRMLVEKLEAADKEIEKLKSELIDRTSEGNELQIRLELAREDIANIEDQLDSERRHVSELDERIAGYIADVSDRDLKIGKLKATLLDAEEQFSQEKAQLQSDVLSLSEKQGLLDVKLKEWELKTKKLKDKLLLSEAERMEMQRLHLAQVMALQDENNQLKVELNQQRERVEVLNKDFDRCKLKYDMLMAEKDGVSARVDTLMANLSDRDNQIREMERHLCQLREKHEELIHGSQSAQKLVDELKLRAEELQKEVDRQRVEISDGAEEKREAIRQLCFSLEHYRSGYQELRQACQAFIGHKRNVVMAA